MKVVLIDPPRASRQYWNKYVQKALEVYNVYPSMGLASIAAVLREDGINVKIIDARSLDLSHGHVAKMVEREKPEYTGITASTSQVNSALRLSKRVKEVCPHTKIVLGGSHVHFEHRRLIKNDFVDFCVRGEGELTFLQLIKTDSKRGDMGKVKGLTFKERDRIFVNPERPFIDNLDELPFPARDLLPNHRYKQVWGDTAVIVPARGCPFNCHFCSISHMWRGRRQRSVDNILDEIESVCNEYGASSLRFLDPVPVFDKKWFMKLCMGYVERGLQDIPWACDGKVGFMSDDLLKAMKEANCQLIYYGIEFGNQRILDLSGKGFKISQVYQTVDATEKAGILPYGLFLIGYPTETKETIEDTVNMARDLVLNHGLYYVGFNLVIPYPGTRLHDYCRENGLLSTSNWDEYAFAHTRGIIRLRHVTQEELEELYCKAHYEVAKAFRETGKPEVAKFFEEWGRSFDKRNTRLFDHVVRFFKRL